MGGVGAHSHTQAIAVQCGEALWAHAGPCCPEQGAIALSLVGAVVQRVPWANVKGGPQECQGLPWGTCQRWDGTRLPNRVCCLPGRLL